MIFLPLPKSYMCRFSRGFFWRALFGYLYFNFSVILHPVYGVGIQSFKPKIWVIYLNHETMFRESLDVLMFYVVCKVLCISVDSSINLVFFFSAEISLKVVLQANLRIAASQLDRAGFFRLFCLTLIKSYIQRYISTFKHTYLSKLS